MHYMVTNKAKLGMESHTKIMERHKMDVSIKEEVYVK